MYVIAQAPEELAQRVAVVVSAQIATVALRRAIELSNTHDEELKARAWHMLRTHAEALGLSTTSLEDAALALSSRQIDQGEFEAQCESVLKRLSSLDLPALNAPSYASVAGQACRDAAAALSGQLVDERLLCRARDILEPLRFSPLELAPLVDSLIYVTRTVQTDETKAHAEGLADRLLACATRLDGSREKEIERKFLLSALPEFAGQVETYALSQGYLPGSTIRERVRRTSGANGSSYRRTIKAGRGVSRIEFEEPIEPALFQKLWPLTEGARVEKKRHVFVHEGLTWEIDEFIGRDLVLAEVELDSIDHVFSIPEVVREVLVREVTHESGFVNLKLAR